MHLSNLKISNFRCYDEIGIDLNIKKGLTVFVGENDSGKTAIIDAIRFAIGTRDQEWNKIKDTDFYNEDTSREIKIICKFEELTRSERGLFLEYLSYESDGDSQKEVIYVNWTAKKNITGKREYISTEISSGINANGPSFNGETRELLKTTYLRPLRDAENAMSSKKNSRLAQILKNIDSVKIGKDNYEDITGLDKLSVIGIANLTDSLLINHTGIKETKTKIDQNLSNKFLLKQDKIQSKIEIHGKRSNIDQQLKQMLEKLTLNVEREEFNSGNLGLGTNNLLYMACELLLLQEEDVGNKMLLIEEPESHIHVQRQLKILKALQNEAIENNVQILTTTHSPILASVIKLENIILIQNGKAFSLGREHTKLNPSDYSFLERYLDATKANLFFAKSVIIVEGPSENILLPIIAKIINYDFADYGVSIVNVDGTGLNRYAKIFQRSNEDKDYIEIPVACVTDLDILPNCAPEICLKDEYKDPNNWPDTRHWKIRSEFEEKGIEDKRNEIREKCEGQNVKSFVSDNWTFEYDLAFSGLGEEVYIAAKLSKIDEKLVSGEVSYDDSYKKFKTVYSEEIESISNSEEKASRIYSEFTKGTKASKPISAQYLARILEDNYSDNPAELRKKLPNYIIEMFDYLFNDAI